MLLHSGKLFIDGLNDVSNQFSSLLFGFISMFMVNTIALSYLSITQIMNADNNFGWERHMVFISYGMLALACLCVKYQVHQYIKHESNKFVVAASVFLLFFSYVICLKFLPLLLESWQNLLSRMINLTNKTLFAIVCWNSKDLMLMDTLLLITRCWQEWLPTWLLIWWFLFNSGNLEFKILFPTL